MGSVIASVDGGSPAEKKRIKAGDELLAINGHPVRDVLDYKFYSYDSRLTLERRTGDRIRRTHVRKREGEDLGLNFETYLMDKPRSCANNCIFCFVDQLPKGMRSTLYFKDDDARLSFLQGNYITLTNQSQREVQRIIDLRISPINVSVHTTDPELRCMMLGNRNAGRGIEIMRRFAEAGIEMNCQIVVCPGVNDGEQLSRSMRELADMYPSVPSVSIVPVGLTAHRQGLYEIRPYDRDLACETLDRVEAFARECMEKHGSSIFFCADEMYLKAGRDIPEDEYYEGYPQLENGVGLLRLLTEEFYEELGQTPPADGVSFTAVTGVAALPFIEKLLQSAAEKDANVQGRAVAIRNDFFGHTIDVAGLVTGGDIIKQLSGKDLGERVLIPHNMLRHGETVFLDDVTVEEVEKSLNVRVRIVMQDGHDLARAFFGE